MMTMLSIRTPIATTAALLLLLGAGLLTPTTAHAQCAIKYDTVEILEQATSNKLDSTELNEYFNKARCECGTKVRIRFAFKGYSDTGCSNAEVIVYAGRNCYNTSTQAFDTTYCKKIWGATIQSSWKGTAEVFEVPAYSLMGGSTCPSANVQNNALFLYVQDSSATSTWTQADSKTYTVDTSPPSPPTAGAVTAGEQLVDVSFSSHTSDTSSGDAGSGTGIKDTNFKGYQILCEELNSSGYSVGPAFTSPPTAEYEASKNLCGVTSADAGTTTVDSSVSDASKADASSASWTGGPQTWVNLDLGILPDAAQGAGTLGNPCRPNKTCDLGLKCINFGGNLTCVTAVPGESGGECKVHDGGAGTKYCDPGAYCYPMSVGGKFYCTATEAGVPTPDKGTTLTDKGTPDKCVGECLTPDAGVSKDSSVSKDSGSTVTSSGITSYDKRYICSKRVTSPGTVRITGLKNNTSYAFYAVTIDKLKNPSSLLSLGTGKPVNEEDFWERYKRAGGSAEGDYCFVATAAYGDLDHPHVRVLRDFRDDVLMPTDVGRALVSGYYTHAPKPATWLSKHDTARAVARVALWPVTLGAGLWVYSGVAGKSALLLALALAFALALYRVRARLLRMAGKAAPVALIAAIMLSASPALAQFAGSEPDLAPKNDYVSDQWFMLEIKLGPYSPDVDGELDGSGYAPYDDMFGGNGLMVKGELDVEFWRPFGTFAVGGEIGWFSKSGKALTDNGTTSTPSSSSTRTAGDTSINLVPLALLMVYRADFLWERWSVPVIPYAKIGFNYTFWWVTKGDGSTASATDKTTGDTEDAKGGTFGWQVNAGLSILLDVFEPQAAKNMDVETGINHVYLFFEFTHIDANNFGSDTAFSVGDTTYQGGLAFEF